MTRMVKLGAWPQLRLAAFSASFLVACLVAENAPAQATTANAHTFMSRILIGANAHWKNDNGGYYSYGYPIINATSGECETKFQVHNGSGAYQYWVVKYRELKSTSSNEGFLMMTTGIEQTQGFTGGSQGRGLMIDFGSVEQVDRVKKAVEVLRKACDPTAGLGF